ncbi:MAG: alpha-L-fucosidase [Spirochaetes bacterium]|nr:alpha-L-fucosidase [Spirochaetota bacterium]
MPIPRFGDGRDAFFEHRFGLFIHWGIYALDGWHEQVQWRRNIPKAEYVKRVARFHPEAYDPAAWIDFMKSCGMSYFVLTTKHHDGFCLWDTKETDYSIMNTPYGKDLLAPLAAAAAKKGVKVGLYYSCPDWHHPNAINQGGDHELKHQNPGDEPDENAYIEYVKRQTRELASHYGPIFEWFWDIPPKRRDPSVNRILRELQPGICINDRGWDGGDFNTPERHVPGGKGFERATEACESLGQQSWGWREEEDYFTPKHLMQSMAKIMAMGGKYLLNIGPKPDGTLPEEPVSNARRIGQWYLRVREALHGEPCSWLLDHERFMLTLGPNALYVVFHQDHASSGLVLPPIDLLPKRATVLNDGSPLWAKVEVTPARYTSRPLLHLRQIPQQRILDEPIVLKLEYDRLDEGMLRAMAEKPMQAEQIF